MKFLEKSLFLLLILGTFMLTTADLSIDQQIENIKNAPAKKRVEMMNQFKLKMAEMNQQERSNAISKLQEKIQNQQNNTQETDKKTLHQKLDANIDSPFRNSQYDHYNDLILNQPNIINK